MNMSWPLVALIVIVFFMVLFKKDISLFLGRTQKIGKDGIHTLTVQIQQDPEKESLTEKLMKEFSSIILREQEDTIRKDLEGNNQQDKINLLIRRLALNQIILNFERVNAVIWGSQIAILDHLNSRNGDTTETLKTFYDSMARIYPDTFANYSFENYLNFMVGFNLITQQQNRYFITNLGREFLVYLAASGQTKSRML